MSQELKPDEEKACGRQRAAATSNLGFWSNEVAARERSRRSSADRLGFAREIARRGWKPEGRFSPDELAAYETALGERFRETAESIIDALDGKLLGTHLDNGLPTFFQTIPVIEEKVNALVGMIQQTKEDGRPS